VHGGDELLRLRLPRRDQLERARGERAHLVVAKRAEPDGAEEAGERGGDAGAGVDEVRLTGGRSDLADIDAGRGKRRRHHAVGAVKAAGVLEQRDVGGLDEQIAGFHLELERVAHACGLCPAR